MISLLKASSSISPSQIRPKASSKASRTWLTSISPLPAVSIRKSWTQIAARPSGCTS
jgi:hypothetical protein